jgi:hypothetical protein
VELNGLTTVAGFSLFHSSSLFSVLLCSARGFPFLIFFLLQCFNCGWARFELNGCLVFGAELHELCFVIGNGAAAWVIGGVLMVVI